MPTIKNLTVRKAKAVDWYRDIVRVHHEDLTRAERKGSLVRITCNRKHIYAHLRGSSVEGTIALDLQAREHLSVHSGEDHEFVIEKVGAWGALAFVWLASDPVYRITGKLAVLSLALAILSVVIAIPPMWDWFHPKPACPC